MSHASTSVAPTLSLDVRSDALFESQVRTDARRRLKLAHQHNVHQHHASHEAACPSRLAREKAHARKWRRNAVVVAFAAFGAGLLWPVSQAPAPESGVPQSSHSLRIFQGELLASLDQPSQRAH